jgi:hypothetical protein
MQNLKTNKIMETLKEAVEIFYPYDGVNEDYIIDSKRWIFISGAKWQQQNSNVNALHFEIDFLKREIEVLKHQQEKTIEEVFEWLTTNNYLTDLKETMIKDFNKFKNK